MIEMAGAAPGEAERELAWQVAHNQLLERQLDQALARAYTAEQTCARLWAALAMLAQSRGDSVGPQLPELGAPAWPAVADQLAVLLAELAQVGELPTPTGRTDAPLPDAPADQGADPTAAARSLTGMNLDVKPLAEAPAMPADEGLLLSGPVSLVPTAKRAHHAASSGRFDFGEADGRSVNRLDLLCRPREVPFLRFTVKASRTAKPAHLVLDTRSLQVVQRIEGSAVRLELATAELRDGWIALAILIHAVGVPEAGVQIALSETPSSFVTHFGGREGQGLDLAWLSATPLPSE